MNTARVARLTACVTVGLAVLIGSIAGSASASDKSIKAVIRSYDSKILVAEGHVVSAIGEYRTTRNPAPVQAALDASISVLRSLKLKIAHQSAVAPKVKRGKAKLVKGLQSVIAAYEKLKAAFALQAASPKAAEEQAAKADEAVKKGRSELREGIKLLR
jgi:hypothetical protein